jgi:hypothetical protein
MSIRADVYIYPCYIAIRNIVQDTCVVFRPQLHMNLFPFPFPYDNPTIGKIPFSAPLCIDTKHGFCWGLSGCPVLKSVSRDSSRVSAFVSYYDKLYSGDMVAYSVPVKGVNDLCELKDQTCYNIAVGGRNDANGAYDLCGLSLTAPSRGTFCVTKNVHNNTMCSSMDIKPLTCEDSTTKRQPLLFVKYAAEGEGWGQIKYMIKAENGVELAHGSLRNAQIETDAVCLEPQKCYVLSFTSDPYIKYAAFVFCG